MPAFTWNENKSGSPIIKEGENANFGSQKHFNEKLVPNFHTWQFSGTNVWKK